MWVGRDVRGLENGEGVPGVWGRVRGWVEEEGDGGYGGGGQRCETGDAREGCGEVGWGGILGG